MEQLPHSLPEQLSQDPELQRLVRQHLARRRRDRLRQATERSLHHRLLGGSPYDTGAGSTRRPGGSP